MSQTKAQLLDGSVVSVSFGAGSAAAPSINYSADSTTGIYFPGSGQLAISTNGSQRLAINSSGAVTIPGTLGVTGAITGSSTITSAAGTATANGIQVGTGTTYAPGIYSPGTDQLAISTNGTGRLFVDANGNVSIGSAVADAVGSTFSLNVDRSAGNGQLSVSANGTVRGRMFADNGTGEFRIGNPTANPLMIYTSNTERMRITAAGLVGLGTTSPGSPLDVFGGGIRSTDSAGNARSRLEVFTNGQTNNQITLGQGFGGPTDNVGYLYNRANAALVIGTNDAERLRVTSGGLVGIGTSTPQSLLSVVKSAEGTALEALRLVNQSPNQRSTSSVYIGMYGSEETYERARILCGNPTDFDGNNGFLSFWTRNLNTLSERLRITSAGNVGIGTTGPSEKLHVSGGNVLLQQGNYFIIPDSGGTYGAGNGSYIGNSGQTLQIQMRNSGDGVISFAIGASEAARIDTSRRLLVGTSSARGPGDHIARLQVEGTGYASSTASIFANSNDAYGSYVFLGKSRGTAVGSNTVVQSGDSLGQVRFSGTDGTGTISTAFIETFVDGTPGTGSMPGRLVFSTTPSGSASPTERMRINNTGSVTLLGATSVASGTHSFQDNGSSPNTVRLYNTTDSNNTGNRFLICDAAASVLRAEIRSNGGLANYSANNANLSDRNAKKDISLAADTWSCVKEWEIVNYRYKDQPDNADLNLGVIAQQIAESCPEVITVFQEAKDATETEPTQEERLGVKEQQMYWMAIKALQEAQLRIESLEVDCADMLARLTALEAA